MATAMTSIRKEWRNLYLLHELTAMEASLHLENLEEKRNGGDGLG